ncbi:MAG: TonB-dependent receptor [Bacteroidota bacterium]
MFVRISTFLLGLVLSLPVLGQELTLRGVIQDSLSGDPLIGATVAFPADKTGTLTQSDGSFSLPIETKGRTSFQIKFSYSGYSAQTLNLSQAQIETGPLNISLTPTGYTAEEIVITASKGFEQKQSDVTVSIAVVKPRSINLQATPNVDKVITQVPGVDNQDGQINIRGSSGYAYGVGSRVMVAMDGLPLLTGDAGQATLDLIPVDNIAQVEVMKGASSVLYGSAALGGVINVITADPGPEPRTSVRLRGGFYDTPANPALDWDGNKNALAGSAHIFHSRKIGTTDLTFQTDFIKDTGYRQHTDQEQFRGLLLTKFRPKNVQGLTIGLNASTRIDSSGQILYWRNYFPDTLMNVEGQDSVVGGALTPTTDAGGLRRQLSTYLAIDPSVKYLTPGGNMFWYRGRFLRNSNRNDTDQESRNFIFYNDFLYQTVLAEKINWVSGLTYTYGIANGDSLYGGSHPGTSLGIYTQLDGKFGKLNTSLGFRYETVKIDTLDRESRPVFRAGLNYEIRKGTNVRASFGQAFRVPTVAERYANTAGGGILIEPNPNIGSENGYSLEVGFRQGYRTRGPNRIQGYLDVAAFRMNYNNMIEFGIKEVNFVTPSFSSVNVSAARIDGIEITTLNEIQIGKNWSFLFSGGITLTDPTDLNAVAEEEQLDLTEFGPARTLSILEIARLLALLNDPALADRPQTLKYRSRHLIRASATAAYGPFAVTGNFRYRSFVESVDQFLFVVVEDLKAFRDMHPNGNRVLDLILSYDFNPTSTLSLTIDNINNEEYMVIPGLLAPQRKFTLQYLFRF